MLRIFLFGAVRLEWNRQPYKLSGLPKLSSLLAYLLLHRAHPLEREQIAFTLWADESEKSARANLRRHLYDLKRALPPNISWFLTDAETVQWNPDAPFSLDVAEFETRLSEPPSPNLQDAMRRLAGAVGLYQGDLCANLYDDWLNPERERMRLLCLDALDRLIALHERAGDVRAALEATQQLARHDPLREETYRTWMRLLAMNGDRAGVVRVYNLCVTTLARELDVEPDVQTKQLYAELLHQENNLSVSAPRPLHNLPQALTMLIGREKELSELDVLRAQTRLVTLTGTGGVGKTSLALHAAHAQLSAFRDGAWFLDLSELERAQEFYAYVARVLEIAETSPRPLREIVMESLRAREILLVLDNCEHVVEAAAAFAQEVLKYCPRMRLLATSREALRVPGEYVLPVAPLFLPDENADAEKLLSGASTRVLIARVQMTQPAFRASVENAPALARICRAVEGIPLALELAAARLNVLGAAELAARLESQLGALGASYRTAPARHQTLRATFEWSFEGLVSAQKKLLARLTIFSSGFTLDAAETVCGFAPLERADVLTLLSQLVEKSLLVVEPTGKATRYVMLNVTRQFALTHAASEFVPLQEQLVRYFAARLQEYAPHFYGARQVETYAWVQQEYANLRAAMEFARANHWAEMFAHLCGILWPYWWTRGLLTEGRAWLRAALEQSEMVSPVLRADLLNGAGRLAVLQGDETGARPLLEENLVLRRTLQESQGIGDALNSLGVLYFHAGEMQAAVDALQESLVIFSALGHAGFTARALSNLGDVLVMQGDVARGMELLEEGRARFQTIGATRGESIVLINLGTAALQVNDAARANKAFRESLLLKRELQDRDGIAWTFEGLAAVALREHNLERACQLLGAAKKLRAQLGMPTPPFFIPYLAALEQTALEQFPIHERDTLIAQGSARDLEQAIAFALE